MIVARLVHRKLEVLEYLPLSNSFFSKRANDTHYIGTMGFVFWSIKRRDLLNEDITVLSFSFVLSRIKTCFVPDDNTTLNS
jgi:hypothetical protein